MMKKKVLAILLVAICTLCLLAGCEKVEGTKAYKKAYKALQETSLTEEGTYKVTEELIIASKEAEYTKPKNIIFMIGDGMGKNIVETTREYYEGALYNGTMAIDLVPQVGWQSTYSADAQVTDSAAGGTALSCGYKTSNGTIAMDKFDRKPYKTVLEVAAEKGMSTGIVATKAVTDATPASFTAHVIDRGLQDDIAAQQMQMMQDGDLDLILGGGLNYYKLGANAEVLGKTVDAGASFAVTWEETLEAKLPHIGLYSADYINTYDMTMPTVAEMTEFALEQLSKDKNGFFLMVEGSQIDTKAHANSYFDEVKEMYDFDCAIGVALKFVTMHPDTVLIITADHETGGLHLPMEESENMYSNFFYTTGSHTSIQVPVYAIGYGVEALSGIRENVDVARFIASLMAEEQFGQASKVTELRSGKEAIQLYFDEKTYSWNIPKDEFQLDLGEVANARALHFAVKNTTAEKVHLPMLILKRVAEEFYVEPQVDYMEAREEMILTYVLPGECWEDGAMGDMQKMTLSYGECPLADWKEFPLGGTYENATFEITEIWITDRGVDQ